MRWIIPLALIALTGCTPACLYRSCGGAEAIIDVAAIAIDIAVKSDSRPSEGFCSEADKGPAHTCPAKAGQDPR